MARVCLNKHALAVYQILGDFKMNFVEKYKPMSLKEVVYPSEAVERRIMGYASGKFHGHILLHGPNGTGKTTVANLLVKEIGGLHAMIETRTSDDLLNRQDLRQVLLNSASLAKLTTSKKHFLVFNEFDQTKKNMAIFWTALDECGDGIMLIITTNEPMNIHKSIRSRCNMIEMSGISSTQALQRVQYALKSEGLILPDAQVLDYLKPKEHMLDFRKYMLVAEEMIYMSQNGFSFSARKSGKPNLKVV